MLPSEKHPAFVRTENEIKEQHKHNNQPLAAGSRSAHPAGALLLLGTDGTREGRAGHSTGGHAPLWSALGNSTSLCKGDVATKSQRRKPSKAAALTGQGKTRSLWGQERSQPEMTIGCRAGKAPEPQTETPSSDCLFSCSKGASSCCMRNERMSHTALAIPPSRKNLCTLTGN